MIAPPQKSQVLSGFLSLIYAIHGFSPGFALYPPEILVLIVCSKKLFIGFLILKHLCCLWTGVVVDSCVEEEIYSVEEVVSRVEEVIGLEVEVNCDGFESKPQSSKVTFS
jgi:hypothetical protein